LSDFRINPVTLSCSKKEAVKRPTVRVIIRTANILRILRKSLINQRIFRVVLKASF
jgi:hypothetical protein